MLKHVALLFKDNINRVGGHLPRASRIGHTAYDDATIIFLSTVGIC